MNRRRFLQTTALIGAYSAVWGGRALAAPRGTALVIGAGMAGLAAARELRSCGVGVTLLEGRDRLGGRVWTDRSLGIPVDLGGQWIEGTRGNPISKLADEFGAKTTETGDEIRLHDYDGRILTSDEMETLEEEFDSLLEEVEELAEELDTDISIGEGVRRALRGESLTREERRMLNWAMASMATDSAADFDQMALAGADDDEEFGGEDVIFPGGYGQIADGLARDLDVRLSHRVAEIVHGADGVTVKTDQGEFKADRAIVTLPLGVLKKGTVKFTPELPERKREAIRRLDMGVLDKAILKYERAWWPGDFDNFSYLSAAPNEWPDFFNHHKATGDPVLIGFCAGSFAREMEKQKDEDVRARLTEILRTMFGSDTPAPAAFKLTRWASDPFTHGAYSFIPVGGTPDDRRALAEPIEDRVYFAGEATSAEYPATVHGAFLSGVREADRIAR